MGAGAECLRLPCAQACVRSCWTWDRSLSRIRPVPSVPRHAKVKHGHPASLRLMLALLYDVHGNLPALEAVLEDAEGVGADRFLLGGDYAFRRLAARDRRTAASARRATGSAGTASAGPRRRRRRPTGCAPAFERCAELLGPETVEQLAAPARDDLARRRALLPRLADLRRAELHAGGRPTTRRAPRRPHRRAGWCSATPTSPSGAAAPAACSCSTRAAWACPSTATPAPPTRSSTATAAIEHRRVELRPSGQRRCRPRACTAKRARCPPRRIEQARFDVPEGSCKRRDLC